MNRRTLSVALVGVALISAASIASPAEAAGHGGTFTKSKKVREFAPRHVQRNLGTPGGSGQLIYHGGNQGVGVTTGAPKVYLVFWGSQWGTAGTDGDGYTTFSNDAKGVAPRLQGFFKGLGTNSELWSGVMTESCEGVASGSTTCAPTSPRVGYPTGGALAGVWYDDSAAQPVPSTDAQIAQKAADAAVHFGNTTASSNRNVQYFVVSPSGAKPGNFNNPLNWCAWHDWTSTPSGPLAFTNMPYVPDVGYSCGANYVNSSANNGAIDGVTIVGGHEYAETITDQFPGGGWWDAAGYENSDKCAWIGTGVSGANEGAANIALSTGSFPVQSNYSNVSSSCKLTAPVQSSTSTVVSFTAAPGNQTNTVGDSVSLAAAASSTPAKDITYSASGLPAGLSIDQTGTISGTPTAAILSASVKVTATSSDGASASTSFTWTVNNVGGNTVAVTALGAKTTARGKAITSFTAKATDDQANQKVTWSATGLPAGITIGASTGTISGTPTTAGTYSVTVKATDLSSAFGTATFTWYVAAPVVTNPGTQSTSRSAGIPVSLQIAASDVPGATLTYSARNLPSGLTISSSTGLISGKVPASTSLTTKSTSVTVTDNYGVSSTVSFSWKVVA